MQPAAARVLASHGRHATVETESGERVFCKIFGRRLEVVCGDQVRWTREKTSGDPIIVERLARRSALMRTDSTGRTEVIVANVTQLIVVVAPLPAPDFFVVDRYVAAAELQGIASALVLNKVDIGGEELDVCRAGLQTYARIGYPVLECSAVDSAGIDALTRQLTGQTTVLVGQSGVGKSSLANRLLPGLDAAVRELSRSTAEGKHTTTVSTLHHLPFGGDLIDSPGVRDFAPAIELLERPDAGFRELMQHAPSCRFNDCRHLKEPGCAVRTALEEGHIDKRRYESYRRLIRLKEQLQRYPDGSPRR